jgi:hypothetical protein
MENKNFLETLGDSQLEDIIKRNGVIITPELATARIPSLIVSESLFTNDAKDIISSPQLLFTNVLLHKNKSP